MCFAEATGQKEELMDTDKSSYLWRKGHVICAQGQYRKGLRFLEEATLLNSAFRKSLADFYRDLALVANAGGAAAGDLLKHDAPKLWQRYLVLSALHTYTNTGDYPKAASLLALPDFSKASPASLSASVEAVEPEPAGMSLMPFQAYSYGRFLHRSQNITPSMDNMYVPLEYKPVVDDKGTIGDVVWPLIICMIILGLLYGSMIFFVYLGDYMGWHK